MDLTPPAVRLPEVGDLLAGKYKVERAIAVGGMGAVFAANHEVLGKRVAVKVLAQKAMLEEEATIARFLREAQAAARLQTEHVARVTDAGMLESGLPFLVMEYLEGCDLAELLKLSGPLPHADVVDYVLQGLEAVAQAHAINIVHRDLKPSNLFLALRPDGSNIIKILDFGISKTAQPDSPEAKSLTGNAVLGSPAYMSPEQVRNARNVDARSDIWSLGVVIYELLTGKIPFDGEGVGEILAAILAEDPKPIREARPDVPEGLEEVVLKCLKRDRDERYASAADFARALEPFGSGKWAELVGRIEQVLVRSQQMRLATPPVSIVVAPGIPSFEVPQNPVRAQLDFLPNSAKVAFTRTDRGMRQPTPPSVAIGAETILAPERSSRRRNVLAAAGGAAAIVLIAVLGTIGARHGTRSAAAAPSTRRTAPTVDAIASPPPVVETASAVPDAQPTAVVSAASVHHPPPHAAPTTPPKKAAAPASTSTRPSILKQRD
jgi:eukaryotic-like serine/threonine-protein kinase